MAVPGFDTPGVAAIPTSTDLYFAPSVAVKSPGLVQPTVGNYPTAPLMFGGEGKYTSTGEAVTGPAVSSSAAHKSSWKEVLNFHGSPAPWVLIGILLVAGLLHLQAGGRGRIGKADFGIGGML